MPKIAKIRTLVDKLPPPRRGVLYHFRSIESCCLYMQKHGLEPKTWKGDVLVADFMKMENDHVKTT